MGTMSRAVMYNAASSASAAEAMTNLMIGAMERMGPLTRGPAKFDDLRDGEDGAIDSREGVIFGKEDVGSGAAA